MAISDNIKAVLMKFLRILRDSVDFMKLDENIGMKKLSTEELCQQIDKILSFSFFIILNSPILLAFKGYSTN